MPRRRKSKFGTAMVDISLNCLLFRDGEENYEFTTTTNTANSVKNFKKDIKEKIKGAMNDFNDIEADQLMLWIVNSDKKEFLNFSSFVRSNNMINLEGIIGDYWAEQPLKEFTHVIVYTPYLTILQKLHSLAQEKEEKEEAENKKKLNMDPEKLGERNILPVLDPIRFRLLNKAKNKFLMKFEKKITFSCVCEGIVDDKEVIVAFVDQSEGTPVHLPAEFEGFPVLISYEALELYHRSFHKDLIPGISIGHTNEPLNAITLGPLFQNTAESNKTYILTAKHGVEKEGETVVQPGTLDQVNTIVCAKITKYNFIGADSACHYLDYALCETVKDREIPKVPNVPFGQHIQIRSIKTSVNNNDDFVYVMKVGRTTFFSEGLIQDMWMPFFPPIVKKKNKNKPKERRKRFALQVFGINGQPFAECGDSGSPVFDDDGKLWGICIAGVTSYRVSYVVPIHLILDDIKEKFNNAVFTLKKELEEVDAKEGGEEPFDP